MQIHELTKRQIDEGIVDQLKGGVKGAIQGAKQSYQQAGINRNVAATADKAANVWASYKMQLDQSFAEQGKKATPADYEKALLAFVSKNLLRGQYLNNLTNKDDIIGLVKKIAGTTATSSTGGTTTQTDTGLTHKASATNPNQPPAAPAPAGAGAFGQMAKQVTKPGPAPVQQPTKPAVQSKPVRSRVPSTPAGEPFSIGGQTLNPKDPKQAELIKRAQTAAARTPVSEAIATPQEKQLFAQLVRAAALASPVVQTGEKPGAKDSKEKQPQDAAGLVDQVRSTEQQQAQLTPAQLAKAGEVLRQTFQIDSSIESTGDQAVDALLLAMGFKS